jgi:hypothetical protein
MQAQTQMAKGELLYEIQGKSVSWTVKEITPHGVKMQMNDQGQSTGKVNAGLISTIDMFMKTDGNQEWESKGIQRTPEGDMIAVSGRGTGRMSPTTGTWQGELAFMTQSPKLAWLNNTKGWVEGTIQDMAQGTYHAKVYAKK